VTALYYVLREGLVRGQGRYWLGHSEASAPACTTKQRRAIHLEWHRYTEAWAERYTADGYPMRVIAVVARRK
jgi:hypothetical protein